MSADKQYAIDIEPLSDERLIMATLGHPRVWPHISDDATKTPEDLRPALTDGRLCFCGAYDGTEYLGLFLLHAHNFILFEVHTALLPKAWGPRARAACGAVIKWVFDTTECRRLITCVPDGNLLALRLAEESGMQAFGYNPRSLMRGGQLIGQHMLGMDKG
jgi:RimJ/RimL family protein N-acetyltransferase